jgi:lysophospholipase L1-like esterase
VCAVNGGMGGFNLKTVLKAYKEHLRGCEADLTVVSLACNDSGMGEPEARFAADLKALVQEIRGRGSKCVFIVEASDEEAVIDGFRLDPVLRRVGAEMGIPVIDANGYLRARHDTGFLFVDLVHPTSYGHRLVAECLAEPIAQALGISDCPKGDSGAK